MCSGRQREVVWKGDGRKESAHLLQAVGVISLRRSGRHDHHDSKRQYSADSDMRSTFVLSPNFADWFDIHVNLDSRQESVKSSSLQMSLKAVMRDKYTISRVLPNKRLLQRCLLVGFQEVSR